MTDSVGDSVVGEFDRMAGASRRETKWTLMPAIAPTNGAIVYRTIVYGNS